MENIRIISSEPDLLGESPVWDAESKQLYWADLMEQTIHCYHTETHERRKWTLAETIGCFALCNPLDTSSLTALGAIVALRSGIYHFNFETEALTHIVTPEGEPRAGTRLNDGKVSPDGRFFVGTMAENLADNLGVLYVINSEGQAEQIKDNLIVSNGLAWSGDGKKMYHSCSRRQQVWVHDYDPHTGKIGEERLFTSPSNEIGRPDGGACDLEGCYWSAGVSAGMLNRFSPSGELLLQIPMPMRSPTMPCFGGEDMRTIFVTSLSQNHTAEDWQKYPHSGCVAAIRVDTPGAPIPNFTYEPNSMKT